MNEAHLITAAVLVIGDEILSGRTQDVNVATIARFLAPLGIDLAEARFVCDVEAEIVAALTRSAPATAMFSPPGVSVQPMTISRRIP